MKIVCRENGETREICESLPFSCEIETDTHGDSASEELWTAFPYVTETDVSLEDGKMSVQATLVCHADLHRNSPMTVLRDIYSVAGEESVTTEPIEYQVAVAAGCETLKMRHELRPTNIQLSDSREGVVTCIDGTALQMRCASVCVHGDNEAALASVKMIRQALEDEGVLLTPMKELIK